MGKTRNINVGIMSKERVEFFLDGEFFIEGTDYNLKGNCEVEIKNGMIQLKGGTAELNANEEIILSPMQIETDNFLLKDVTIGVDFHWEQQENQKFNGAIKLIADKDKIVVINIVPIEQYLISVISSEMNANSSLELLKAHAIISRSWLIAQIEKQDSLINSDNKYQTVFETDDELIKWYDREEHEHFHVCADDHCQRYQGIVRTNKSVEKAVNETKGLVLTYDNKICDARFSKCCGGVTELFENCWEPIHYNYLPRIADNINITAENSKDLKVEENAVAWINNSPEAFCNTDDKEILSQILNDYDHSAKDFYRWKVEYSQDELSKLITEKSGYNFGEILDLTAVERGESGRLIKLKITGTKKIITIGKELEIRKWLSKSHLYSSSFVIEKKNIVNNVPQNFVITGAGWGHGVGLCQIGAAVMAHKGYSYEKILHHYFKNVTIKEL